MQELENRLKLRQATLVALVPPDPPAIMFSSIMSPDEE
jgi:hypothetical protein